MVSGVTKAQALRQTIEAEMAESFSGALTPRPFVQRAMLPFGIAELDRVTGGGVPVGAITELVGAGSTGKTSAAMQIASAAMRTGKACAWVDASDSFDPQTGAENGMLLPQLLWVRCGGPVEDVSSARAKTPNRSMMVQDPGIDRQAPVQPGRCGSHPRGEEQGLDRAVRGLFQSAEVTADGPAAGEEPAWPDGSRTGMHSTRNRQALGTPGAPNVPLSPLKRAASTGRPAFRPVTRDEQAASDRLGGRKAQAVLKENSSPAVVPDAGAEPDNNGDSRAEPRFSMQHRMQSPRPWARLDQALRAADLLLQGGGFSVIVFDLGSIAPEHVLRIPAATWFRFRAVAESSGTAFVLLSQAPCARSSAGLVLSFRPMQLRLAGGTVVEAAGYAVDVARQRFQQEQVAAAHGAAVPRKQPTATWQASSYLAFPPSRLEQQQQQEQEQKAAGSARVLAMPDRDKVRVPLLVWKTASRGMEDAPAARTPR